MLKSETIQGRTVSGSDIAEIAGLIKAHPHWSRWRLSRVLAERWQWHAASGQLKDMAARSLLLKLHQRGLITLPERRRPPATRAMAVEPDLFDGLCPEPVVASLASLQPLRIQVVGSRDADYGLFHRYLRQHHYLGYRGPVGENMGYLVRSHSGTDLACLLFGAAAWQCAVPLLPENLHGGLSPGCQSSGPVREELPRSACLLLRRPARSQPSDPGDVRGDVRLCRQ